MLETLATWASPISFSNMEAWLEYAFYPTLLLIFLIASMGVPIPEDLPLIAAGVLLRIQPGIATWHWTIVVSLIGILSGDIILYSLGRRWGPSVFAHKSVAWLVTPAMMAKIEDRFHRQGSWMVFFGRFVLGVRAAMCLTAGVTRFPFFRFFLADLCGAVLTIPMFIGIGYYFAGFIDPVLRYLKGVQWTLFLVIGLPLIAWVVWQIVRHRRKVAQSTATMTTRVVESVLVEPPDHDDAKRNVEVSKSSAATRD